MPAPRSRTARLAPIAVVALVAACSPAPTSSTGTSIGPSAVASTDGSTGAEIGVDEHSIAISLTAVDASAPLGEPIEMTLNVRNTGDRSLSVPIEVGMTFPDGTDVGLHRTTLFAPHGGSVSEDFTVTTSRWSRLDGTFQVRATVTEEFTEPLVDTVAWADIDVLPTPRIIPTFEDVTIAAGVETSVPEPSCGQFANGSAWGDIDGDGWTDLVITRLGATVRLFVNAGDGTFTEQSLQRGVDVASANGASFADYDNDGDPDLLLVGDGSNTLLRNDGTGRFTDVTIEANLAGAPDHRSMSAAWADYDDDGLLDLYVANYMACTGPWSSAQDIITNVGYHADVLYRNDGDGGFTDVTALLPDADRTAAAFSVAWLDANGDGRPDLYVGNDFVGLSPDHNRLWLNGGPDGARWIFDDASIESGAGLYMNTMGIGIGDIDRDGDDDLALSNIGGNKLLVRSGDPADVSFSERPNTGIERPLQGIDQPTVTWGTILADFDLDGWLDLFMAAGNLPQGPDVVVGDQANMLFLNDGTGERFLDVSGLTGTDAVGDSKGVAAADYDGDGDIDLHVVDQGGQAHLYRNVTERSGRHWVTVALTGTTSNRDACGAQVTVVVDGEPLRRTVSCGSGGTGSGSDRLLHFGLGTASAITSITVDWPSGTRDMLGRHDADQIVRVVESSS
jgi:hypothetical protein